MLTLCDLRELETSTKRSGAALTATRAEEQVAASSPRALSLSRARQGL